MATISEALAIALQHHQAGRLADAEQIYRQILAVEPEHSDALHLLGLVALQAGHCQIAIDHIGRAIQLKGTEAAFHNNLGEAYRALGMTSQAIICYHRALEIKPDFAEVHNNLGNAFRSQARLKEAIASYRCALELKPEYAVAYNNLGSAFQGLGNLKEAVTCFRQALEQNPDFIEAHNNLGVVFNDQGNLNDAITCFRRALELNPDYAKAHSNLGNALQGQGHLKEAVVCYQRALELNPAFAEAHNNLGVALNEQGKLDDAVTCFRRALELNPNYVEGYNNLGNAFQRQGNLKEAVACFCQALELRPDYVVAYYNLGNALRAQGKLTEAVACYRRALELKPDFADAHNNLGIAFKDQGKLEDAMACSRRALELKPDFADAHNNLGITFYDLGNLNDAVACYDRALALKPDFAEAYNNLGNALQGQGNLKDAVACFRRSIELMSGFVEARDNLLLAILYYSGASPAELREAHAEFDNRIALPLQRLVLPHTNNRTPNRRLRVGYVSPDFRDHVVGRNMWPLFREHDHQEFEVFAYANSFQQDEWTARFQSVADAWREVAALNDEALAQQIRDDQIDILVDLALHTAHNRLLVFARKPAPVQVTFAGYPGTTGLTAMDYRLTDPYLDPPGLFDDCYSEESIRLPATWWCYDPLTKEPTVQTLPAIESGLVTFGCLNNFCKVNEPTLKLWARVLRELPGSRLLLLAPEGTARQQALTVLGQEGVPVQRVSFVAKQSRPQYLELYHQIDIGLDTLPYNGHTTSLDSYWMGVPVVTLVGQTVVGRAGLSQLSNLGLPELIAQTPDQFVQIAVELALNLPRLAQLRQGLRQRMQNSPLMDAKGFARGIEDAYRTVWQRWCAE